MKKISIIIPVYNEEEVIDECYNRINSIILKDLTNYDVELLFINDGSKDKTFDIIENYSKTNKNIKLISFSRNFGHQAAVTAGMKFATGDANIIIDADMQDPPELIIEMVKLWENGNEIIYAKRKKRKGETIFKVITAKAFYKILNGLSDVDIPRDTGDFRLIDKKIVEIVNNMPEHNKFLRGIFSWIGFKQIPIEYVRNKRFAGKTKYSLRKMFKLASDGIISFSIKPLKFIGGLGIFSIILSFLILIYAILSFVFKLNNLAPGWTSIMVTITFFAGIQLISIWMISEYVGRIYDETKQRPEYIIDKKINIEE